MGIRKCINTLLTSWGVLKPQKNPLSGIRDDALTSYNLNEDMTEE